MSDDPPPEPPPTEPVPVIPPPPLPPPLPATTPVDPNPGRSARWALLVVLAILAVGIGAFLLGRDSSDDDDDVNAADPAGTSTTTTTTEAGTEVTAGPATTVAPGSTTSTQPPSADLGAFPDYSNDEASGSGCSPGEGDLPDGWWFGSLPGGVTEPTSQFDLACFFVGDAAVAAAQEDGDETALAEGFVENDYWVRDQNPSLRDLVIPADVEALCVYQDPADAATATPCGVTDVGQASDVWIRIVDGQPDRIVEQFVP